MKSFKKLFALVLVVAMFASFGIGATAAFTDQADIDNTAAVQLLSDLGVMNGYPDGSFKPDGNITRAEMAKIIVALKYGAATANSLQGTYTVTGFTDVKPDFWAAAYIGICKNTGVINGVTATTFNPSGNVKVVDAVKMILATLGYGKNGEYVGAGYATNVLLDGLTTGILTGAESLNGFATRDQIAAFVKTSIYATLQTFDATTKVYSPVANASVDTLAEKTFGMLPMKGVVVANGAYDLVDGKVDLEDQGLTSIWVDADTDNVIDAGEITRFNLVTDASVIGETIEVYYKNVDKTTTTNSYAYKLAYGYAKVTKSVSFVTTTAAALDSDAFAKGYTADADTLYSTNGATAAKSAFTATVGSTAKYIDIDGDKKIDIALLETTGVGKIIYVATDGTVSVDGLSSYKTSAATAAKAAQTVATGLALNDYVVVKTISGVVTVSKAVVVTGKVESYTSAGYAIAGGTYKIAAGSGITIATTTSDEHYTTSYNYYLNAAGYIAAKAPAGAVAGGPSYAVVLDSAIITTPATDVGGVSTTKLRLQVLFLNGDKAGTTESITASTVKYNSLFYAATNLGTADGSTAAKAKVFDIGTTIANAEIFDYTVNSVNGTYALTEVTTDVIIDIDDNDIDTAKKVEFATDGTAKYIASTATVFVVRSGAGTPASPYTYTAYTGYANLPVLADGKLMAVKTAAGVVKCAYIFGAGAGASETASYIYVTNTTPSYFYNGGDSYYTFSAIVDGVATTVKTGAANTFTATGLYTVNYTGEKIVATPTPVSGFDALGANAYAAADGTLIANNNAYTYNGTETVYVINTNTGTVSLSSVEGLNTLILATKEANAVTANTDGTIAVQVVATLGAVKTIYVLYLPPVIA